MPLNQKPNIILENKQKKVDIVHLKVAKVSFTQRYTRHNNHKSDESKISAKLE